VNLISANQLSEAFQVFSLRDGICGKTVCGQWTRVSDGLSDGFVNEILSAANLASVQHLLNLFRIRADVPIGLSLLESPTRKSEGLSAAGIEGSRSRACLFRCEKLIFNRRTPLNILIFI